MSAPVPAAETVSQDTVSDEHKGAAQNSAVMALGSLVSRGTGFLRTAAIAAAVGGGAVGNAYATAQMFPGMLYELLLGGILSSVLVPMLVRVRKTDPDRGQAYTQRLLSLTILVLGIATALVVVAAPVLSLVLATKATDPEQALITAFSYLMLPTIFFYGLSGICSAILNSRGHFAAPMWTPILNNLIVIGTAIAYLAMFGATAITPENMTPARIAVLGGGVLLGIIVQAIGLLPALRKVDFRFKWRFDFRALGLRRLAHVGGWMFCYVVVNQFALIILVNLLNAGDGAGTMIYNNVFLLLMMAHGIVAVSIITALLPRMSAAAADGRSPDIVADLSRGIRMVTVVLAPIAVVYAVLALPISIALFERGAFEREHSIQSAPLMIMAGLTLIPMSVSQLFNFTYYSLQDTKTPALINLPVASLRISTQLAWFATMAASVTAVGMMFGNGLSYLAAALLSGLLLRRRIGQLGMRSIIGTVAKVTVAAGVAAVVGLLAVKMALGGIPDVLISDGRAWLTLIMGGFIICVAYVGTAYALRIRELTDVAGLVLRKLKR